MSADPPYLSSGTEVSAKYKGAFCEAKIKKCQKSVKCKVSPKDGGPQLSVTDESVQGHLKIGGLVKVRQPDSGQLIDGVISRIIDSSIYTVVFDDGDVATLKRTQICLKGDKHYMEGDTLDKLPLTNPEHFSTPVNLLKKERRRRSGVISHQSSSVMSDDSDYEELTTTSRRISPRGSTRQALDVIGKVVSLCDKKKWCPALVIKPSNHEIDMKNKGLIMVKSFRDGKIYTVTEKQLGGFNRESIRSYPDDKQTKTAVDKAYKYTSTKELPASWKRDEILGTSETTKKATAAASSAAVAATPPLPAAPIARVASPIVDDSDDESSSSSEEEEEKSDMFIAQLYKFMDDRSTPINKPAQLYNRDVNLSRLYQKIRRHGGFNKVSATGKWKYVAKKMGFAGISAGTEMKLLYRRYLLAFEDFYRKMGDTHMFEGSRSQRSTSAAVGRSVLPPRDRESQHTSSSDVKVPNTKPVSKETKDSPSPDKKKSPAPVNDKKARTVSPVDKKTPATPVERNAAVLPTSEKKAVETPTSVDKKASTCQGPQVDKNVPSAAPQTGKNEQVVEESLRRTPLRYASKKEEKVKSSESNKRPENTGGRGRTSSTKANIKIEKGTKLKLDLDKSVEDAVLPSKSLSSPTAASPTQPSTPLLAKCKEEMSPASIKPKEEPSDVRTDNDSVLSDDDASAAPTTVNMEIEYPPGTKIKVRYGRARNVKIYDAKVVEVRLGEEKTLVYSVHYNGWNTRYDEVITGERIVSATGKHEKKKMDVFPVGSGPGKYKKQKSVSQVVTSASSTGSRTPEPPTGGKTSANPKTPASGKVVKSANGGAAQVTNRTTRSSTTDDLTLVKPTRSRSIDSSMSQASSRKPKQKQSLLAEDETKQEDPDNNDSTDESTGDDLEMDKPTTQMDTSEQEPSDPTSDKQPSDSVAKGDKAPKRLARGNSKSSITSSSIPISISGSIIVKEEVHADDKLPSKSADSVEAPLSPTAGMCENARSRMYDVIEKVAVGEITTNSEPSQLYTPDSGYPLAKRPKVDREDSSGSLPCDEAFVKIEPLTHKKPMTQADEHSPSKDSDDTAELKLPSLIGSTGGAPSADSESKTSALSSLADDSEGSFGSDDESKSPSNTPGMSSTSVLHQAISNLSLLSEQASLSQMEATGISRAKQRSSTRRQNLAAKRSPRPKYSEMDREASPSNDEISHITAATTHISPTKPMKSAPPRTPRQPKFNFRIEEELAEIVDQDERIAYLANKVSEIRSLYSDVKSNLTSIERKRKRVRQVRDREPMSHHSHE